MNGRGGFEIVTIVSLAILFSVVPKRTGENLYGIEAPALADSRRISTFV